MIRVVLAVAAATALLAASLPLVDDARAEHTDVLVTQELSRIERALETVVERASPTAPSVPGTRVVVDVTLPRRTWTTDRASIHLDGTGPRGERITYRVDGGSRRSVPVPVAFATPDGPLTLDAAGTHRLVIGFERRNDQPRPTIRVEPTT